MILNHFLKSISSKEKECLLLELCETKEHLDNIEKTLLSFIDKSDYFSLNLQEVLNCINKTKDSVLNNIKLNNGFNLYIIKNNLTGEIYDISETPFSYEEIESLKSAYFNKDIIIYSLKEYAEFYNKKDGVYYYSNEGIKKSLYTNYENLLKK